MKLDDGFFDGGKARAAGRDGRALYVAGLCYCAQVLNDGVIVKSEAALIAAKAGVNSRAVKAVVSAGLWEDAGNVYLVPDYLEYNPSREQVLAKREAAKERQHRFRNASRNAVTNGVSHAPSPSPNPLLVNIHSVSTSSNGAPSEDELAEVWVLMAKRKLAAQRDGSIKNAKSWCAAVARNAEDEHAERARALWAEFNVSAQQLADALTDGSIPASWGYQRRQATTSEGTG